jgi:CNT family concentrative nucleoside transporter
MLRLVSLLGIVSFLLLAWLLSNNRRLFPWRTVLWGLALQFIFALFILDTPIGLRLFSGAQTAVDQLNQSAYKGAELVFGPLGKRDVLQSAFGPDHGLILAVTISATIIFVASLSSLLYYWGVLQRLVAAMAWVMRKTMGISGSEAFGAATNIFLGQVESALVIKPYLAKMTPSEIMALMTFGMSTIASGVMAVYAGLPGISAGHILTASILGAPAGLLVAKIMFPETQKSETRELHHFTVERKAVNSVDAICQGAGEGVMLAINIMGMLIAFVAMVALLNALLAWSQRGLGVASPISLQQVLGWINAPFAWLMGIPAKDCGIIGQRLGERIVMNEFIGYQTLSGYIRDNPGRLAERSVTLASYALCGFANFGSIGIQIAGIGALVPERRHELARIGPRAMIGGLIACYLFASVVGVIVGEG